MNTTHPRNSVGLSRRHLLKAGLTAGVTLSTWPLTRPSESWGRQRGPPNVVVSCVSGALIPPTLIRILSSTPRRTTL